MLDFLTRCDPRKMWERWPRADLTQSDAELGSARAHRLASSLSSHRHKAFFGALALPLSAGASTTMIAHVKRRGPVSLTTSPNCVLCCDTEPATGDRTQSPGLVGSWRAQHDRGGSAGTRYGLTMQATRPRVRVGQPWPRCSVEVQLTHGAQGNADNAPVADFLAVPPRQG
jgi:hypothetical protein